jgi:hypothetical protein
MGLTAVLMAGLLAGVVQHTAQSGTAVRCSRPGEWPRTADAEWTARVITASGFRGIGCTGSALVIDTGGRGRSGHDLYVWANRSNGLPDFGSQIHTIEGVRIHYDDRRAGWHVQGRNVWIEAGPTTLRLLPLNRLRPLIRASATTALAGRRVVYPRDRLSFVLPSGWHVTAARINGVVDPVTIFTATTFRLQGPRPAGGICSATLQRQWHVRGAYVQLAEERDGASLKRMLRRVPPRPRHFVTRRGDAGGLCTPADSGEITFHERGRAFYAFYGIGKRASPATRNAVRALLDSLRIGRR